MSRANDLRRALRTAQRYGDPLRAFRSGERFGNFEIETRSVGRLTVSSNAIVACDPFSLGFGYVALGRRVPRGQFPVTLSVARVRKGKRMGEQRVAAAMIRFGDGDPVGFKLAGVDSLDPAELLGADYAGYPVESGYGCFVDEAAAKALKKSLEKAFSKGELDPPAARRLRQKLAKARHATTASASLDVNGKASNLLAFCSGWGDGNFPSYWGYDDERRLACLITDFLVLPTRQDLIRSTWQGSAWREFHYEGDRGDHFWRVRIQGSTREIRHGRVGEKGQVNQKEFATSDAAYSSAAKRIGDQTARGFYEVTLTASRMRAAKRQREASEASLEVETRKAKAKPQAKAKAKAAAKPKTKTKTKTAAKPKPAPKAKTKAKPKAPKARASGRLAKKSASGQAPKASGRAKKAPAKSSASGRVKKAPAKSSASGRAKKAPAKSSGSGRVKKAPAKSSASARLKTKAPAKRKRRW